MRYMELWTDLLSCPLWHRFWTTLWCCRLGTLTAPHCCLSCRWLNRNSRRERREKKKSGRQRRRPVDKVSVWSVWELLLYNRIQIINVLEFDTNCICVATKSCSKYTRSFSSLSASHLYESILLSVREICLIRSIHSNLLSVSCLWYHGAPTYQVSRKALHLYNTTLQSSTRPWLDLTITLTRLSILTINSFQSIMKCTFS